MSEISKGQRINLIRSLTPRELEIAELVSLSYTNERIADKLFIGIKTVEHHLNYIYSKLKSIFDPGFHPRVTLAISYWEASDYVDPLCWFCHKSKPDTTIVVSSNAPGGERTTSHEVKVHLGCWIDSEV